MMLKRNLRKFGKGLENRIKTFIIDYSRFCFGKYDQSDEWIEQKLLGYAVICNDIQTEKGVRENAKHAYNLIHSLCDDDRTRIRKLYSFYYTARRLSLGSSVRFRYI